MIDGIAKFRLLDRIIRVNGVPDLFFRQGGTAEAADPQPRQDYNAGTQSFHTELQPKCCEERCAQQYGRTRALLCQVKTQ